MNWPWKLQLAQMATLVIDEISMLDGEFLEEIDALLRAVNVHRKDVPFGGVQVKKKILSHTRICTHVDDLVCLMPTGDCCWRFSPASTVSLFRQ